MDHPVLDPGLHREIGAAQVRHAAAARRARTGVADAFQRGETATARALVAAARHHERAAEILTTIARRFGPPAR